MGPISSALTKLKENLGSFSAVAREVGLDRVTIRSLIREENDVSLRTLQTLAAYFQWTAQETGEALLYEEHLKGKTNIGPVKKRRKKRTKVE